MFKDPAKRLSALLLITRVHLKLEYVALSFPTLFCFFLFFPHMHVSTSELACKLLKERNGLHSLLQCSSVGSHAHWTNANSILLTDRNTCNLNSTGDPTYNLLNKQIPRNNFAAGFVLLVSVPRYILYAHLAKSVWVWCLKIGIFPTKCHLDEHLVLKEEQNSLLTVDGKLARFTLLRDGINTAPNLATNTVL